MQRSSFKVVFLVPLVAFAICISSLKTEAEHIRQMPHHHHHSRRPDHCAPIMPPPPPPPVEESLESPSQPPTLPPTKVEPSAPAPVLGDPVVVLPPGYQLTPFHVHACNSPCIGPNDCYWPCMACCANSTCCDR